MSNMRLSNKEKSLLIEFKEIQDFNNNLCKNFIIDNFIENKYYSIGKKYDLSHNIKSYPTKQDRFCDIYREIKNQGIITQCYPDLIIKPHYIRQANIYFNINHSSSNHIESTYNNKIELKCNISLTLDSEVIHSLSDIINYYNELKYHNEEFLTIFERQKKIYIEKFEELKTQLKSYDEVFLKYDLLVKDWKFKNS